VSTAIIPQGNSAPIFDPTEHDLDVVPLLLEGLAIAAPCHSVLARWDTRCDALFLQAGDEPIRVITAVGDQMCGWGKAWQETSGSRVIAHLPF
jgi:hypothetical protein